MKKLVVLVFAGAALLAGCDSGNQPAEEGAGEFLKGSIKVDGSSTVYPITEAIAEEFRTVQPDVRITVGVSGTGGGFKKFSRGETDINDASRPIKGSEIEKCRENNINYVELTVAYDGLAVIINPQNDWVDYFTVEELKKIWEPDAQEKITRWNQIRPEWPNEEIHLFGPGVESGTYDYFTEVIVGKSHSSRGDYTASEDDNVLVQGVSTDKYALGFFGLAYYEENKNKLKLIGVDDKDESNGSGAITPSLETVKNGTYAPLSRPVFIYVNNKATKRPEVQSFVNFYLENAASLVEEVGYIPLPEEAYKQELKEFKTFSEEKQAAAL